MLADIYMQLCNRRHVSNRIRAVINATGLPLALHILQRINAAYFGSKEMIINFS